MTTPEVDARIEWLRHQLFHVSSRRGAVVQTSGGVDSAVTLYLCARAFGPDKTAALFLPDSATAPETRSFANEVATGAGVRFIEQPIGPAIEAQQPRAEIVDIIRAYFPQYDDTRDAFAIDVNREATRRLGTQVYELAVGPKHGGATAAKHVRADDLRRIIAYQNRKQRTRMLFAYAVAEANDWAVVGASNRDELRTGFVVKYGDDAADFCAIGDLAKPDVYDVAPRALGVPQSVIDRKPTTDTFALLQSQDDYYYSLPPSVIRELLETDDDADFDRLAGSLEGWSAAALRQTKSVFASTVRYNTSRSLIYENGNLSHDGSAAE